MARKIKDIKNNPNNPRTIDKDKIEKLINSIEKFPKMMSLRPIIIDNKNIVLGGNMRLQALKKIGYKEIPDEWVKYADDLTEEEKQQFIIKDNVGFGDWDYDLLANEWNEEDLKEWGMDLPDSEDDIEPVSDNDINEDVVETNIKKGDLIEIGKHRLICGDNTNNDNLLKLLNGSLVDMVFTDPPYEIEFDYNVINGCCKNGHIFIFNNDRAILNQLSKSPLKFKKFFIFNHSGTAIPQEGGNEVFLDHILISHEIIGKPKTRYNKGNGTRTVLKGEYRRAKEHKHEKPASVLSPIINGYTIVNDIILDVFAGGGKLFDVAHQLNRVCYGIELEPINCQTIINRMKLNYPELEIKINNVKI